MKVSDIKSQMEEALHFYATGKNDNGALAKEILNNVNLQMPDGLTFEGQKAWGVILTFLVEHKMTSTGGCKAFYSPAMWKARGEAYADGILVVVYDGGDLGPCFGLDHECYKLHEEMRQALEKAGFWAEEGTTWYSNIYLR